MRHLLALGIATILAMPAQAQLTQLVILGTGTPNADPERSGPALAVVHSQVPDVGWHCLVTKVPFVSVASAQR